MKSVAIHALVGLLAATGSVDAHVIHGRSCKAKSVTLSASIPATATATSSSTFAISSGIPTFSVTPNNSTTTTSSVASSTAVSVTPTVIASSSLTASSSATHSTVTSRTSSASTPKSTSKGLDALWKAHDRLYIGASSDKTLMDKDGRIATTLLSDFGSVTPENSMKWNAIEPSPGKFSFANADFLVNFAQANGMQVRGHALVWQEQLPAYVEAITDKETLKSVLINHITTVVSHFKDKVRSWDVVNEVFNDDGSLRESVFYKVLGEEYISLAFRTAHAADPSAKLYINEYSLDAPDRPKLVNGMVPKVMEWLAAGIPIHGIGSESHLTGGNVGDVPAAIKALAATGVSEIALTELDISNAPPEDYVTVFNACLEVPSCVGITVWGVSDATAWRPGSVLFDSNYQPKPALAALKADLAA